jgi:anti-sigma regulatory factor (Ser/Thr protein kinase)
MRDSPDITPRFEHSAFLYDSDDAYVGTLVPFLRDGLRRGEATAVATSPQRIALLREALDDDAAQVRFLPDHEWYVRPVRTIAGWARVMAGAAARGHPYTRLVGQVRFGPAEQHLAWVRFESAVNRALAGANGHLLCPYDRRDLPPHLIEAAGHTHPVLRDGRVFDSQVFDSRQFRPPERLLAEVPEPAYPVHGDPMITVPIGDTVSGLREHIRGRARAEGWLPSDRLDDLILAVSEVTTNGVRHGGGRRELRVWVTREAVVCEVTDEGAVPPDPLAGYLPPAPGAVGGMGLWLVHQLCDAVAVHRSDGRTSARFAVLRPAVNGR